jgi:aminoglycoside phosphotransferase
VEHSRLLSVVIGHSKDPNAKLTIVLVSPETASAVLAVKAPTSDVAARAVEAEMRVLLELERLRPPGVLAEIPRVVDVLDFDGRTALVTTAVPGAPMSTSYVRWRHTSRRALVAADFAAAGTWLARLQHGTAGERAPLQMGAAVVPRLRARFAGDQALAADLDRLGAIHARLASSTVRRSAVHGDFWIGNVLLSRGCVSGVVDWEAGAASGEPVRDLVRFALMYALYLDRRSRRSRPVAGHRGLHAGEWGAGVRYALDGSGWFADLFRRFLQHGLGRLGASPDHWRDAALAGIAEVAAFTDDPEFGRHHLELFRRLPDEPPARRSRR